MDRLHEDREDRDDANEPLEPEVIAFAREEAQAAAGFRHAFFDFSTCAIYLSMDPIGRPVKATLIAGFERNGLFYTRRSAARAAAEWLPVADQPRSMNGGNP